MGLIDSFLICPNNPIPKNDTNTILFIFEKIQGSFISKILILQVGRVPGPSDRSAHETVYKQCVRFTMGDKMWLKHRVLVDVSSLGLKTDLAYSWLTELLDVVKHALSGHLVVALFDSLAIKGDSLICIFFFFTPAGQVPVISTPRCDLRQVIPKIRIELSEQTSEHKAVAP